MAKIAKSNPNLHEVWNLLHKCNLNYTGSSAAMETAGAAKYLEDLLRSMDFTTPHFKGMVISKPTQQSKKCTRMITELSQNMNALVITKTQWAADFVN